jgi:hypothetical protein
MAIIETKKFVRPNTSVSFYTNDGKGSAILDAIQAQIDPLRALGKVRGEISVSEDGLTQTGTVTYTDLDAWSQRDTLLSIALDAEFMQHSRDNSITGGSPQYTITGIDYPFTCTTVYTFQAGNTSLLDLISNAASADSDPSSSKLKSATATETTLTLVHQFDNSDDFTANHFNDIQGVVDLNAAGVTRTITYAAV